MNRWVEANFPIFFPIFFVGMWLTVTSILAALSGWFRLMAKFPNRPETAVLRLRGLSGSMGPGVALRSILRLSVCPSGLRVGIWRLFGPFSRDFFVPWDRLSVTRGASLFGLGAKLQFGHPEVIGTLRIPGRTADKLARTAAGHWPEPGPFPLERTSGRTGRLMLEWVLYSGALAFFFVIAPRMLSSDPRAGPPILVAILFPAVVIGLATIVRFFRNLD